MSELKAQRYKDDRPAEKFMPVHEWSRAHRPGWVYELVRVILTPIAVFLYRTRGISTSNVPADGPFILAPNHFSNMDHFFTAVYLKRKVRFMAKSQLFFRNQVLDYIYRVGGVFPVRRGHHDEEAFITAYSILDRGQCIGMYCEGGRSRSGGLGEAKPGVGRLALESGVPVVPVAIHGSENVRGWSRLKFPKVTIQFGEPLRFAIERDPTRERQLESSNEIFDRVRAMYDALERDGRAAVRARLKQ